VWYWRNPIGMIACAIYVQLWNTNSVILYVSRSIAIHSRALTVDDRAEAPGHVRSKVNNKKKIARLC
jgi:hypothetical protein